jgi:hypothetical protein
MTDGLSLSYEQAIPENDLERGFDQEYRLKERDHREGRKSEINQVYMRRKLCHIRHVLKKK